jgi:hypothetical protein
LVPPPDTKAPIFIVFAISTIPFYYLQLVARRNHGC